MEILVCGICRSDDCEHLDNLDENSPVYGVQYVIESVYIGYVIGCDDMTEASIAFAEAYRPSWVAAHTREDSHVWPSSMETVLG